MGGDEDGRALLAGPPDEFVADRDHPRGVEAVDRLIEDEQFRVAQEGAGQGEALAHAEREGAHLLPALVGEPDDLEGLVGPVAPGEAPLDAQRLDVLPGGEIEAERRDVDEGARAAALPVQARGPPEQRELAGAGARQAGEQPDERRLAGAVLTHEAVDLPGPHLDRHVVERLEAPVGLAQPLRSDDGLHHCS